MTYTTSFLQPTQNPRFTPKNTEILSNMIFQCLFDGHYSLLRPLTLMEYVLQTPLKDTLEMKEKIYIQTHDNQFSEQLYEVFDRFSVGLGGFEKELKKVIIAYI